MVTASVKLLTETVVRPAGRPPLTEAGCRPARLKAQFKRSLLISFGSSGYFYFILLVLGLI